MFNSIVLIYYNIHLDVTTAAAASETTSGSKFKVYEGRTYMFKSDPSGMSSEFYFRTECLKMSMDLVIIRSEAEIDFITSQSSRTSYIFIGAECSPVTNRTINNDGSQMIKNLWNSTECTGCGVGIIGPNYSFRNETGKFTTMPCLDDMSPQDKKSLSAVCVSQRPLEKISDDQTKYFRKFSVSILTFTVLSFILIVLLFLLTLFRK